MAFPEPCSPRRSCRTTRSVVGVGRETYMPLEVPCDIFRVICTVLYVMSNAKSLTYKRPKILSLETSLDERSKNSSKRDLTAKPTLMNAALRKYTVAAKEGFRVTVTDPDPRKFATLFSFQYARRM